MLSRSNQGVSASHLARLRSDHMHPAPSHRGHTTFGRAVTRGLPWATGIVVNPVTIPPGTGERETVVSRLTVWPMIRGRRLPAPATPRDRRVDPIPRPGMPNTAAMLATVRVSCTETHLFPHEISRPATTNDQAAASFSRAGIHHQSNRRATTGTGAG
jgi:hypothetical protein